MLYLMATLPCYVQTMHSDKPTRRSSVGESCWTVFQDAIINGRVEICHEILTPQACSPHCPQVGDFHARTMTSLQLAGCLGALSPKERLVHLDAIAFRKLRTTSLHMAALYRRPHFVRLLLEQGADPLQVDGFGRTPGAVLLEHWPRVQLPSPADDCLTIRPLTTRDHISDTTLQLQAGSDGIGDLEGLVFDVHHHGNREMELFKTKVMVWRLRSAESLHYLLDHCPDINHIADRRRAATLLHIAARYDLTEVIETLVKVGRQRLMRDINSKQEDNDSSVVHRRVAATAGGEMPCEGGAGKKSKQWDDHSIRQETTRPGLLATLKMMRRRGDNAAAREKSLSAVSSAASVILASDCKSAAAQPEECSCQSHALAANGRLDLEVRNATCKTPLAVAVDRGAINAVVCLLKHGASCLAVDLYGRSILHFLCERDMTFDHVLCDVLSRGVDINCTDNGGNTPLHTAALVASVRKIELLVQSGASLDTLNLAGKSPLFLAFNRKDSSAREVILLFLLSSVGLRLRDKFQRLPLLLQRPENQTCLQLLDDMAHNSFTLFHRCVIAVRRQIGFGNLMSMAHHTDLRCPYFIQLTVFGQEERRIVTSLCV
ncbi:tankyrase-1-like isoform X2 [Pomacea canaliculata]|uniref:tankyrase-1-like isoform X2 n=1 Tax=Pomacea canaliculata TaxID=400727 RepID=UPI000D73883B|nr:tankyrase-1-like isoform X2 [Pomacea canaliculata]